MGSAARKPEGRWRHRVAQASRNSAQQPTQTSEGSAGSDGAELDVHCLTLPEAVQRPGPSRRPHGSSFSSAPTTPQMRRSTKPASRISETGPDASALRIDPQPIVPDRPVVRFFGALPWCATAGVRAPCRHRRQRLSFACWWWVTTPGWVPTPHRPRAVWRGWWAARTPACWFTTDRATAPDSTSWRPSCWPAQVIRATTSS